MGVLSLKSLPLGFRFRPTDEELIDHYLRHKINGKRDIVRVIQEVDVCKCEPWDLPGTFVELNARSRKWQCPICLKNYSLENIILDPYFNRITSLMQYCGEDVTKIEVKLDGSWCPKVGTVGGDLGQWHLPDGTLCVLTDVEVKPKMELSKQIKQEGVSEGHTGLKLGIKKNRNGYWEVSKPEEMYVNSLAKRCF